MVYVQMIDVFVVFDYWYLCMFGYEMDQVFVVVWNCQVYQVVELQECQYGFVVQVFDQGQGCVGYFCFVQCVFEGGGNCGIGVDCFGIIMQNYVIVCFDVQCGCIGGDVWVCFVDYCDYFQWYVYFLYVDIVGVYVVVGDYVDWVWQCGYFVQCGGDIGQLMWVQCEVVQYCIVDVFFCCCCEVVCIGGQNFFGIGFQCCCYCFKQGCFGW